VAQLNAKIGSQSGFGGCRSSPGLALESLGRRRIGRQSNCSEHEQRDQLWFHLFPHFFADFDFFRLAPERRVLIFSGCFA
jgi:hypothetical protein